MCSEDRVQFATTSNSEGLNAGYSTARAVPSVTFGGTSQRDDHTRSWPPPSKSLHQTRSTLPAQRNGARFERFRQGIMSDIRLRRIGGVVYGLRNMMAWLWGVAYDRTAICGRVAREAKDLPTVVVSLTCSFAWYLPLRTAPTSS